MDKKSWIGKLLICLVAAQLVLAPLAMGQQAGGPFPGEKPVMENVFFNVVWGSIFGIILGVATAVIEADVPTAPEDSGDAAFSGATAGGMIGLAVGLFMVATGASFDPEGSLLFTTVSAPDPFQDPVVLLQPDLPFTLETSRKNSFRITGFRATVLDLRF